MYGLQVLLQWVEGVWTVNDCMVVAFMYCSITNGSKRGEISGQVTAVLR